jgi:hypothetical protein
VTELLFFQIMAIHSSVTAPRSEGWAVQRLEFFLESAGADAQGESSTGQDSSEAAIFAVSTGLR